MLKSLMENLQAMGCDPAAVDGVTVKINAPVLNPGKSQKIIGYTIKSVSDEGAYYLINGWYKHFGFWLRCKDIFNDFKKAEKIAFKTAASAKSSLTKLLKVMPEYSTDNFILCGITECENIIELEGLKK
jgi:hypothetical protein